MKVYIWAVFVTLALTAKDQLAAQKAAGKLLTPTKEVKIGKLPNGFTYYIRKNQEPKDRAELRLVVKAGSILETDNQVGLAHFTEHMAFNGTKNFKKQELVDFLEKSGVQFGADLNAYTSFDETVYQLQLPTDSPAVFKKGFQILEDWAHNVSFDENEIDKERGVVIEEWRLGQGAAERLRSKYAPVLFKGSQYAKRSPIGTRENLDTFKYATIKQFYRDWYRPDLQAVIVVGDVNVAQVEQMIIQHFSKLPKASNPKPRKKFGLPSQKETQTIILTDPEQPYNVVELFYKQPAIPEEKTDLEYRASIIRQLFNTMMSNRLQEISQKPDAPFLFGNSNYDRLLGDKDALVLAAYVKDGSSIPRATEALLQENERVKQNGFSGGELERTKAAALAGMENAYNERGKSPSSQYAEELIRNFLEGETIPGIEKEFAMYKQYLPGIKLQEVNSLISKWIKPTDRTLIVLAPESEKDKLPSAADMLALINKQQGTLTAYEDKMTKGDLLAKPPIAGKITSEKKIEALGLTEITLSNGIRVVLKPTDFKNNQILFSAVSRGGLSLFNDSNYLSSLNATTAVIYSGLGNYDFQSLQKQLAAKQVSVSPYIGQYAQGISGSSTPKDLSTAFQLIYGYFTEPRKDTLMFNVIKQQLSASLANKDKDPSSVFSDSVAYILGNYHFRRKPLTIDRLKEINADSAFAAYNNRFSDAAGFVFIFVGNFTVDSIRPLLQTYIASLPVTNKQESWRDVGLRYPSGPTTRTIYKGTEKKSAVRITFTGMTTYSDLEATQLDQTAKALEIKLREVLREDQGGVYGVGVSATINREPVSSYIISISFGCAPDNTEKLIGLVQEQIEKLKKDGATATDVQKVIAEDTRSLQVQAKDNSYWLYNLQDKYYYNEDPTTILQDAEIAKKLTVEKTRELANKYFDMNNMTRLVLMPER